MFTINLCLTFKAYNDLQSFSGTSPHSDLLIEDYLVQHCSRLRIHTGGHDRSTAKIGLRPAWPVVLPAHRHLETAFDE